MLVLLEQGWPWLMIGLIMVGWGLHVLGLPFTGWLRFFISQPFTMFSDDTQAEKEIAKETLEEITQANPGCVLIGLGLMAILVGLFKIVL